MNKAVAIANILAVIALPAFAAAAQQPPAPEAAPTVQTAYPTLAQAGLTYAAIGDLPEGVLVKSEAIEIAAKAVEDKVSGFKDDIQEQLKKNRFLVLEQIATRALLLKLAVAAAANADAQNMTKDQEEDAIQAYLQNATKDAEPTDDEIAKFYEENKADMDGKPIEELKDKIKRFLAKDKRQDAVMEFVHTIAQRTPVTVSAAWTKEQAALAMDNPFDKARLGGGPMLGEFYSDRCPPCQRMKPTLDELTKKYAGKIAITPLNVDKEQIIAARFGVSSIPVQVFFDKQGREVSRHVGYYSKEEIEKELEKLLR